MEKHRDESPATAMTESSVSAKPHALVTGDARFIGSALIDRLLAERHAVTALDDLSHGKLENLRQASLNDDFEFITADVLEVDWDGLFECGRLEVIFHLAVQIDMRVSVADPMWDATLNIIGTIKFVDMAQEHGAHKIVSASSGGSIYSTPEELPAPESVLANSISPYTASKATGELYLNMFRNPYGLECSHTAPANVYGPRQDPHDEAGVVTIFTQRLLAGEPIGVLGGNGDTRDYVYADDAVDAFYRAPGEVGGGIHFNIDTGVGTSDRQLHLLVAQATDVEDSPEFTPSRTGNVVRLTLDPTRTRKVLGRGPAMSIHEDVACTMGYFRDQG